MQRLLLVTKRLTYLCFFLGISWVGVAQEICNNGIDDDGDGLIDCLDGDCAGSAACPAFSISSTCSPGGGTRADILSTQAAYRAKGSAVHPTFTIPVGANRALIYISSVDGQTSSGVNPAQSDEDFIVVGAVLDLTLGRSSGYLNYALDTDPSGNGTQIFGWENVALGNNVLTGAKPGHDITPALNDITFSVAGNVLTITEANTNIHSSYVVEFTSPTTNSLVSNGFSGVFVQNGSSPSNTTVTIPIPANTNIINITGKGTAEIGFIPIPTGGVDEPFSNIYWTIDLDQGTVGLMDGYVSVGNGGIDQHHSTYVVNDHDLSNTTTSLTQTAVVTGFFTGKETVNPQSIGVYSPRVYVAGGNLVIERDPGYASTFEDSYVVEFFRRTGQPMSAEFIASESLFIPPGDGDDGDVTAGILTVSASSSRTFTVPAGSQFAFFNLAGNANNSVNADNENAAQAYAVIDFNAETANGYYYQQVGFSDGRRDDNVSFVALPLNGTSAVKFGTGQDAGGTNEHYDIAFRLSPDKRTINVAVSSGLVNDQYQYLLSMDFFGAQPDVGSESAKIVNATSDCRTLNMGLELCNPGSGNNPAGMPVSFYKGDPTTSATATLLATEIFNQPIPVGQCASQNITIDLTPYNESFTIYIVLNDDGSFANGVGNAITSTFALTQLASQTNNLKECDYTNNLLTKPVVLDQAPSVTVSPTSAIICTGQTVTLAANAPSATSFVWNTGATSTTIVVSPTGTTTYSVTVASSGGCSTTANATVTVQAFAPPTVSITASPTTVCQGDNVSLSATGATTYVWSTGATTTTIIETPTSTTTYTVTGTDVNGCQNSATQTINFIANPPPDPLTGTNAICVGATTTFSSTTAGGTFTTSSTGTATVDGASGLITGVSAGTATITYTTSASGCTRSVTRAVTVNPPPSVSATTSATAICAGASATLTASGATSYVWNTGATGSTLIVSPTATTTYTVTGTDGSDCTSQASVSVTVNPLPTVSATTSATAICAGASATLTVSGAMSYVWNTGATGSTLVVSPTNTTTYTVTGTDGSGCTSQASVSVTVNPGGTLTSVSASDVCQGTSQTINVGGMPTSGTYTLTYSVSGANTITNATVVVSPNGSGNGSFVIAGAALPNNGNNTITITSIQDNATTCTTSLTGVNATFTTLNQVQTSDIIITH